MGAQWPRPALLGFALLLTSWLPTIRAADQTVQIEIPPVKIPLKVKEQPINLVASGLITLKTKTHGMNDLRLELDADLSDLQQNLTELLSEQLDKEDRCGDRIFIQHATLTPADAAALTVVQFHYERWACAKVFGKQEAKRVVGGNAVMQLKLTPAVEENETELRLIPEVGPIQADGSLGELLRSGTLGEMLREKIRKAVLSALQKGTDLGVTLPPAAQGHAKITNAKFREAESQRLQVVLEGEIQFTDQQIQEFSRQLKERVAAGK